MGADNRERGPARNTRHRRFGPSERGSVTAEFAVLLPVVLLCLLTIAGIAVLGAAQVRVQQAAGVAAREAARGGEAEAGAARAAGDGARVSVSRDGPWAIVQVSRTVPLWGLLGPGIEVRAEASSLAEVKDS